MDHQEYIYLGHAALLEIPSCVPGALAANRPKPGPACSNETYRIPAWMIRGSGTAGDVGRAFPIPVSWQDAKGLGFFDREPWQ